MKIIKKHSRDNLAEGRNYGMCFGFLKKISNTEYETVTPISACKDYLNDALYAEKTGRILSEIYGFQYEKVNNIISKFYTPMGISVEGTLDGHSSYDQNDLKVDQKNFNKNYKNVENFINQLEEEIGIYHKTKIFKANDGLFLVKMPTFWTKRIYLLSLYTLLLRAFQKYTPDITAREAIKKGNVFKGDAFMVTPIQNKIETILKGELPKQDFRLNASSGEIHNNSGIVNYKFK